MAAASADPTAVTPLPDTLLPSCISPAWTRSSSSSSARVDLLPWTTTTSSSNNSNSSSSSSDHSRPRIPVTILLNPSESDNDNDSTDADDPTRLDRPHAHAFTQLALPSPNSCAQPLVVVPMPPPLTKRRGRKPHLPMMTNSERGKYYRMKRKRHSDILSVAVTQLRADVDRLDALVSMRADLALSLRMSALGSLARLVREYHTQFRYGVQLPPSQRNMALADVQVSTVHQDAFLLAAMARDVRFGAFSGIDVVMDQWVRYSQYHALLEFALVTLELTGATDAPIVTTTGTLRTRYSRKTIQHVFPHVVGNERLTQLLIGREITYPCRNQFYFRSDGTIERYDVEADFVAAMIVTVGNADDAATILGQALIQKQHMMGVLDADVDCEDDDDDDDDRSS